MRRPRSAAVPQRAFGQVPLGIAPVEVISADQVEAIHNAALKLLASTGIKVLHPPPVRCFRRRGRGWRMRWFGLTPIW